QVLDPELPEPAGAEHERPRTGAEPGARMLDGPVRGQPAAAERRRLDRVEVADRVQVAPRRDAQVLGVAAVLEEPRLAAVGADHLLGAGAEAALAAAPRRVDEHVPKLRVLGDDLVPEHERER